MADERTGGTPVTWALIAANVGVFVAMTVAGVDPFAPDGRGHAAWGSNLVPLTADGQWWRLGSSMFLHFGFVHLLVNMWALYANGRLTERIYGSARYLLLYLAAGLAGSLASTGWNAAVNSAGASGAIFGVLGALFAFMFDRRNGVPASVMKSHRNSVLVFLIYNVAFGVTHAGIDNAAHLGGLVAGIALGLALARPVHDGSRASPQAARVAAVAAASGLVLLVAGYGVVQLKASLPPDQRFAAAAVWFEHHESLAIGAYNDMATLAREQRLGDDEFAARLEAEVIPVYAEAIRRFGPGPLPEGEMPPRIVEYVRLRHDAASLTVRALRTNDAAAMAAAVRIMEQADEAVGRINEAPAR